MAGRPASCERPRTPVYPAVRPAAYRAPRHAHAGSAVPGAGLDGRRVSSAVHCGICGGGLELRYAGTGGTPAPTDLSPTSHPLGAHGNILRCRECATLQQSTLRGRDLASLYREMRDDAYLAEEPGRRRTAARLLDQLRAWAPGGRLLDVGCGHGLLLDEARRRGYSGLGLEMSAAAAAYARDTLGLDVREHTIEQLDEQERFDAIMLVDLLEHVGDPVSTIEQCIAHLRPGGVLCVVTPDPSSLTARAAGRRWWGLVPAHSYLLPRRTLLELLSAGGLVVATDVPFVRSFSLGYWLAGLFERSSRLAASGAGRLMRALGRRASLSLSLGDERAVFAAKTPTLEPQRRLVLDRGTERRVHVVLPAYNAASTIPVVARTLPADAADRALLV